MHGDALKARDFSTWDGTPFFEGAADKGRQVYIVKSREQESFVAYGAMEDQARALFVVQGTLARLDAFLAQVEKEGAWVTYGLPPFDTNTGGDKAETVSRPGFAAENQPKADKKASAAPKPGDKQSQKGNM